MKALIFGITGQDGSYLAEFLLSRGYDVYGTSRQLEQSGLSRIGRIAPRLNISRLDLHDQAAVFDIIETVRPDEIYNLASYAPPDGWSQPTTMSEITALGPLRILEAVRLINRKTKIFQASSSSIFSPTSETSLSETSAMGPITPFGSAKLFAHQIVTNYRRQYNLHACCAISFTHVSPRQSREYTSRKICRAAAEIKLGLQSDFTLDFHEAETDYGFAGDYVRAYWMMLQHHCPDNYVIATGRTHTVKQICEVAFEAVNLDWHDHIHLRPIDRNLRVIRPTSGGDASKARRTLLWEPETNFKQLIQRMVQADIDSLSPKNRLKSELLGISQANPNKQVSEISL